MKAPHPNKRIRSGAHLLMPVLLLIWTIDTIAVSGAVEQMDQIFLLCFKTMCSIPILALFTKLTCGLRLPARAHLPRLIAAAVCGNFLYFFFEYTAIKYLPVGTATLLLGLTPAASYLFDSALQRRLPGRGILIPILGSFAGLFMVLRDSGTLGTGALIGYLSCLACIVTWIAYGYIVRGLHEHYHTAALTLYEGVLSSLIMLPFALLRVPSELSAGSVGFSIVFMGILTAGIGYIIEVKGIIELGTTVSGIYVNFLPICTAIAGFLFLGQRMTLPQCIGSLITVGFGVLVAIRIDAPYGNAA